jgi:hypothetical protein
MDIRSKIKYNMGLTSDTYQYTGIQGQKVVMLS